MATLADTREALAYWFNLPTFMVDALMTRITPTVDLTELVAAAAERGGVGGPRACVHQYQVAAVVAEMNRVQLMNPAGSGIDIHVQRVVTYPEAAAVLQLGFQNTALANPAVNRYLDQRIGISPEFLVKHPVGSGTSDNDAASGILAADVLERQRATLDREVFDMRGVVLPPGFGFRVVDETLNHKFKCSIYTLEKPRRLA